MSALISTLINTSAITGMQGVNINDDTIHDIAYNFKVTLEDRKYSNINGVDYMWPRSGLTGAGTVSGGMGVMDGTRQYWEWPVHNTGVHVRKKITGVTRNMDGTTNGGATVQLFNTVTGVLVDTQVSDTLGNYTLTDPNNVQCFVVGYEIGSPDVAGTTQNNLAGI